MEPISISSSYFSWAEILHVHKFDSLQMALSDDLWKWKATQRACGLSSAHVAYWCTPFGTSRRLSFGICTLRFINTYVQGYAHIKKNACMPEVRWRERDGGSAVKSQHPGDRKHADGGVRDVNQLPACISCSISWYRGGAGLLRSHVNVWRRCAWFLKCISL